MVNTIEQFPVEKIVQEIALSCRDNSEFIKFINSYMLREITTH